MRPPPVAPVVANAPPPPPEFAIRTATEQEILRNVPTGMTVFRFADDRRVLALDFASLEQQGMTLDRVAALIEKAGAPRSRVRTQDELLQTIRAGGDTIATYYYGHDYAVASLQRFFAYADAEHLILEPDELNLRRLLTQVGWFQPGVRGGLISIPAVGANANVTLAARSAILHHRAVARVLLQRLDYAGFAHGFWNATLTVEERGGVRRFLGSEGYDTTYEELMYNEMQAYLMFTRDPQFFTPAMVGMTPLRLAALQTRFLRGMPTGRLQEALAAMPMQVSGPAAGAGTVPKNDMRISPRVAARRRRWSHSKFDRAEPPMRLVRTDIPSENAATANQPSEGNALIVPTVGRHGRKSHAPGLTP